jgi:ATP-dependent Clp protease, protease subunit
MPKKSIDDFNAEDRIGITLLDHSVFFLIGEIEEENANECIRWITYENLNHRSDRTLTIYINSQGGDLYQAFALIDTMRMSSLPIRTIGIGSVMSAAFLILASGTRGQRYIAPNTGIMCHQFSMSEEVGKYHDIIAARKETDRVNQAMFDILKETTGLDNKTIKSKLLPAHDVYMSAAEMVDFGAADHVYSM